MKIYHKLWQMGLSKKKCGLKCLLSQLFIFLENNVSLVLPSPLVGTCMGIIINKIVQWYSPQKKFGIWEFKALFLLSFQANWSSKCVFLSVRFSFSTSNCSKVARNQARNLRLVFKFFYQSELWPHSKNTILINPA